MGDKSAIEWTSATWNCLVGCSRVSAGCQACYAERLVHRGLSPQHRGLTKIVNGTPHWTGEVRLVESALDLPLRWRKPRRIFVNSLSDLFHEKVPERWIAVVFAVMWAAGHHTFQILTKRPARMLDYAQRLLSHDDQAGYFIDVLSSHGLGRFHASPTGGSQSEPLRNVWLGVSVENQPTADERIPLLLQTPAAVRWCSYEPALAHVSFVSQWHDWLTGWATETEADKRDGTPYPVQVQTEKLDWLVVGGESGPGARPFDLAWARSAIAQCRTAGVPVFVKQLGSKPIVHRGTPLEGPYGQVDESETSDNRWHPLRDRKGGDPSEWPEDLRVREYPRG